MSRYTERMADNPVAYFRFNESAPPLRDHISGLNLDTLGAIDLGQPSLADDDDPSALLQGDVVALTRNVFNVPAFTVELLYKPTTIGSAANTLVAHDRNGATSMFRWRLAFSGAAGPDYRRMYVFYMSSTLSYEVAMSDIFLEVGTIQNLAFTYSTGTFRFFRDGLQVGAPVTGAPMRASVDASSRFEVGGLWDAGGQEFAYGQFDEVLFYGTALAPERIHAHTEPNPPIASPLDIPNCILWVSSDDMLTKQAAGSAVAQWDDLSPFGHHLAPSEPTVKPTLVGAGGMAGGPAMQFSEATRNGFNLPAGVPAKVNAAGGATLFATIRTGARGEEGMWGMQEAVDKPQSHAPYSGRMYDGAMSSGRWDWAVSTGTWYRYKVFSNKNAGGNPNWTAWLNGSKVVDTQAAAGYGLRPDPVIGHSRGNGLTSGTTFGGRFGTVVLYDRQLTTGEHAQLDAWGAAHPSGGLKPITVPPLYLGSTKVSKLYLGSTDITTAYLGTTKL